MPEDVDDLNVTLILMFKYVNSILLYTSDNSPIHVFGKQILVAELL